MMSNIAYTVFSMVSSLFYELSSYCNVTVWRYNIRSWVFVHSYLPFNILHLDYFPKWDFSFWGSFSRMNSYYCRSFSSNDAAPIWEENLCTFLLPPTTPLLLPTPVSFLQLCFWRLQTWRLTIPSCITPSYSYLIFVVKEVTNPTTLGPDRIESNKVILPCSFPSTLNNL